MRVGREIVTRGPSGMSELKIRTANRHDTRIMPVPVQECGAERKERRDGEAIILQYDRFRKLIEYPVKAGRHSALAAHVFFGKVRQKFAGPIWRRDYLSGLPA